MNYLSELPNLDFLVVEGADTFKFLQGQLTCDMNLLTPERSLWGAHCNPKGRMISLFRIFSYSNSVWLRMHPTLLPIAENALKKYSVFFKVSLTTKTQIRTLGFSGETAQPILTTIFGKAREELNQAVLWENLLLFRVPGTPSRFELFGPKEKIAQVQKTLSTQAQALPAADWKYQDLGYGIPSLYKETAECFIPQMLYLDKTGGVSVKKGCYTGQEVIARSHYRGEIKRHLCLFEKDHPVTLCPGDPFYIDGKDKIHPQGVVVDSVTNSKGASRILAVVHDGFSKLAENFAVGIL